MVLFLESFQIQVIIKDRKINNLKREKSKYRGYNLK
jgi:hypothetical protein